jgi:ABC-2 type transport system permease protein
MLKIYQRLWQVNWAEYWQYRANMLMYLLYWLISPIVYLAVWTSIANAKGSVSGLTANDFIAYYMTLLVVDQLTSNIIIHIFAYKVQDGSLSAELIRPAHPMLTNTFMNNLASKALNLLVFVPVWGLLWLLYRPDFSAVTGPNLLIASLAMMLGFLVSFLLSAAITSLAFWTTRVYSVHEFYYAISLLFSGQFVPLQLMPKIIQDAAQFLPFQLFLYFPIQIILGKLTSTQIIQGFVSGVIWLIFSWFLFRWVWREGVKRYSAVGA